MDTTPQRVDEPDLTPPLSERPVETTMARPLRGSLRYLLRAMVVLILIGFVIFVLQDGIRTAFMTNPGLNGLITGVLLVGILIGMAEFWRVSRAAKAGNRALRDGEEQALAGDAVMAPIAPVLRHGAPVPVALEAMSLRLDEGRETLRYLAGLLVFLGLLGTFWGLLETVGSIGGVIKGLRSGGEAGVLFDELKGGLAAPLAGMGLSFSSSLFGIAGSLVLGFLDLQVGQAQRRLRTGTEDWLALLPGTAQDLSGAFPIAAFSAKIDALVKAIGNNGANATNQASSPAAMANLAEGIQGLVHHMRAEQQQIRDWVEAQAQAQRDLKTAIDHLAARERQA
jgi:hypothetical protein